MPIPRQPAGTPSGGEFAPKSHSEADVDLSVSRTRDHDEVFAELREMPWDSTLDDFEVAELFGFDRSDLVEFVPMRAVDVADHIHSFSGSDATPEALVNASHRTIRRDAPRGDTLFEHQAMEDARELSAKFIREDSGLAAWSHTGDVSGLGGFSDDDGLLVYSATGKLSEVDIPKLEPTAFDGVGEAMRAGGDRQVHFTAMSRFGYQALGDDAVAVSIELDEGEQAVLASSLAELEGASTEDEEADCRRRVQHWSDGNIKELSSGDLRHIERALVASAPATDALWSWAGAKFLREAVNRNHRRRMAEFGSARNMQRRFQEFCS